MSLEFIPVAAPAFARTPGLFRFLSRDPFSAVDLRRLMCFP
jgi:hypothetical protein